MTNTQKTTVLQEMLDASAGDAEAAEALLYALAAIDFVESCDVEDASTNDDDKMPSLPVMGNVDLDTLVTVGLWKTGKQIAGRKTPPTW